MSTYFALKNPMTKQEMKNIGITFKEGFMELRDGKKKPHTWIVEKEDTNYLHPQIMNDVVHGWTRYGGNNSNYLIDILEENNIEFYDEYQIADAESDLIYSCLQHFDLEDDEEAEEWIRDYVYENVNPTYLLGSNQVEISEYISKIVVPIQEKFAK